MSDATVTLLIPAFDEERALPATLANVAALIPAPDEILLVDGGSSDRTLDLATAAGLRVLVSPQKGRAAQINLGVAEANGAYVIILHADSLLPVDAIAHVRATLADHRIALASFTPRIMGPDGRGGIRTRWGTTFHNWIKTWYAPLIMRPHLFVRGVRLLFGDHAMFFRKADFLRVGGIPANATVMEEADLCVAMAWLGRIRLTRKWVVTSDRRIAAWGPLKANWIYFKVGIMWCFGVRERLGAHYPDVR